MLKQSKCSIKICIQFANKKIFLINNFPNKNYLFYSDMNGALNILSTMKIMGCIPSSNAYNALLYSYAKKGDIVNIMETLKTCERQNILIEDVNKVEIIYYLAINGHSDHIDKVLIFSSL